jgi:acyl dehydratase
MSEGPQRHLEESKLTRLYWDDFAPEDVFHAPWGRTVTVAHILAFSGVNGDFQHMHVDELYAQATPFGGRIAQGNLTAALGLGMQLYTQVFHHVLALLEERHVYKAAVRVDDTIFSRMEVVETRPSKSAERGVVIFRNLLSNQNGEVVCESTYAMMLRRRP